MSNSVEYFHRNLHRNINFSVIEVKVAMNNGFYTGFITGSKGHEVKTKIKILKNGGGKYVN